MSKQFLIFMVVTVLTGGLPAAAAQIQEQPLGAVPSLEGLKVILVSPDCRHVAWLQQVDAGYQVVLDGVARKLAQWILPRSLVFSPDSSRLAFTIQDAQSMHVVVDAQVGPAYYSIGSDGQAAFSPDAHRIAYIARPAADQNPRLVVDSKEQEPFDDIDFAAFSADSKHLVCCATRNHQIFVLLDGKASRAYDALGQTPVFSPNSQRLGYTAKRSGKWVAVIDGVEGPEFDTGASDVRFSPDSKRVTYAASGKNKLIIVVTDGVEAKAYDGLALGMPLFSPDSAHVAYLARLGSQWRMVVDQAEGKPCESTFGLPLFSPDSSRLAYTIARGETFVAVVNGREDAPCDVVAYPAFSPDSKHFAYAARRDGKEFIMLDGLGESKHEHCAGPAFSPDSKHLAYAVLDHQRGAIIVDGMRCDQTYETILDSGRVQFDDAGHLWAIAYRGHKLLRLCIDCGAGGN